MIIHKCEAENCDNTWRTQKHNMIFIMILIAKSFNIAMITLRRIFHMIKVKG